MFLILPSFPMKKVVGTDVMPPYACATDTSPMRTLYPIRFASRKSDTVLGSPSRAIPINSNPLSL
jgi:hypothetical protein